MSLRLNTTSPVAPEVDTAAEGARDADVWAGIMQTVRPSLQPVVDNDSIHTTFSEEIEQPESDTTTVVDGTPEPGEIEPLTDIEHFAMSEGWKPQDAFAGDPDKWVPADQFLAKKPVYAKLFAQSDLLQQQQDTIAKLQELVSGVVEHNLKNSQAEIDSRAADLNALREQAFKSGDFEGYEAATKELAELRGTAQSIPKPTAKQPVTQPIAQPQQPVDAEAAKTLETWVTKHKSTLDRPDVDRVAAAILQNAIESSTAGTQKQRIQSALVKTEQQLQKLFPQHFRAAIQSPPAPAKGGVKPTRTAETQSRDAQVITRRLDTMLESMKRNEMKKGKK